MVYTCVRAPYIWSGHRTPPSPSGMGDAHPVKMRETSAAATAAMAKYKYARHVDQLTSSQQVDDAMRSVSESAALWAEMSPTAKIALLKDIKRRMIKCCMQFGRANAVVRYCIQTPHTRLLHLRHSESHIRH